MVLFLVFDMIVVIGFIFFVILEEEVVGVIVVNVDWLLTLLLVIDVVGVFILDCVIVCFKIYL